MRVDLIDPSAFTPPYDHALAAALARAGATVRLVTSRFAYGEVPAPEGYTVCEHFYRHARGGGGSRARQLTKLAEHVPDMLRYRRLRRDADVAHFQWLDVQWLDGALLPPRPRVLTAHDLLPREPRPGQAAAQRRLLAQMDAIIVHSAYGRRQLIDRLGLASDRVHVIHHGAFEHLTERADARPLPDELRAVEKPVVLFFGLLRPYKGLDVLLDAWRGVADAELWIVGHARMPLEPLRARAPANVRFVPRFIADEELPAYFRRADIVVLPYTRTERFDQSGVLATALAFGTPTVLSDIGGFAEIAATGAGRLVPPGDAVSLHEAIVWMLGDDALRAQMGEAALAAARGSYSWDEAARKTLALYESLIGSSS
jgi:glycosyltransferase involved in cell wall biosynthesis